MSENNIYLHLRNIVEAAVSVNDVERKCPVFRKFHPQARHVCFRKIHSVRVSTLHRVQRHRIIRCRLGGKPMTTRRLNNKSYPYSALNVRRTSYKNCQKYLRQSCSSSTLYSAAVEYFSPPERGQFDGSRASLLAPWGPCLVGERNALRGNTYVRNVEFEMRCSFCYAFSDVLLSTGAHFVESQSEQIPRGGSRIKTRGEMSCLHEKRT